MKYALHNDTKIEATKGVKGVCPICGSELIAKCGNFKINHWAHKRIRTCDPWWEPETEWHRSWKNNYPEEWQEVSIKDEKTSEKHIADIRTGHNLFIEFQHSHIDPKERSLREMFYKNMIWVVDGTRLKRDYSRFLKASNNFRKTPKEGIYLVDFPDEVFPGNWLNSRVPVIFDYKGLETVLDKYDKRNNLYCLFQVRLGRFSIFAEFTRDAFIKSTINGEWTLKLQKFIESLNPKEEPFSKQQLKVQTKHREGTHYYDPKKGRFIKKWRF
jgi:hypothetical protein